MSGKFTASTKIEGQKKPKTQIEQDVSQAFVQLESPDTRDLKFLNARDVEVANGKHAVVIVVPYVQRKAYREQTKFIPELEKKLGGKQVVVIAKRRILPAPKRNGHIHKQKRPNSRTLAAVHEAILDDLVYPAEIVGKRTLVRVDGTKLLKVHLDNKAHFELEHKLDSFATIYKRLTGVAAAFEFASSHKRSN